MALFTPVGQPGELALTTLRLYVEAVAASQSELAGAILATAQPESPDDSVATVAGTIGVALDLLDEILSGQRSDAPAGIGARTRFPKGHWGIADAIRCPVASSRIAYGCRVRRSGVQ